MIKCPKCSRLAEPQERYCSYCHAVFPSDTLEAAQQRLAAGAGRRWKLPTLVVVVLIGAAFTQIDANDMSAEAGSFRATARDMKRTVNEWIADYTGFLPSS